MAHRPPPPRRILLLLFGAFLIALQILTRQEVIEAATTPAPTRIGVLLPLTGRFALPGQEVKRGLELALKQQPPGAAPIALEFRDTQEDPQRTAAAVRELVEKEQVVALIGPLVSATVDAAAHAAAERSVPMLVLTQKPEVPHLGRNIFRFFMTADQQMKHLAAYAMDQLGLKRFAIAYPEQRYGMELAGLFWDEVVARGGVVAGVESYPPGTSDFQNTARKLGGKFYQEPRRREFYKGELEYLEAFKKAGRKPPRPYELPPIVDFDAIFIPDGYKAASALAASLAYTEVPVGSLTLRGQSPVRLLGSSSWNNPDLVLQGGIYVEESLFVDSFFPQSPDPKVQAFVSSFKEQHGKVPDVLAATGYDALGLISSLIDLAPIDRATISRRLASLDGYAGVTGEVTFDERGEPRRPPYVLSVREKHLVQLSPVVDALTNGTLQDPAPAGEQP